jgi:hypothetical protein
MHATIQKPIEEIVSFIRPGEKVFVVGCNNCAQAVYDLGVFETFMNQAAKFNMIIPVGRSADGALRLRIAVGRPRERRPITRSPESPQPV